MRKYLLFLILGLFTTVGAIAQVTTSSITGTIKDAKGETLVGATVKATHQPSGTNYATTTNADGRFTIPNARIGGPYLITISYVGYNTQTFTDINLQLGQPYVLNATLQTGAVLQDVVVKGTRNTVLNSDRQGASTNINSRMIATLPSISRSITDYTRLTPQANGNSFGGRDNRMNNTQVDGANLNNSFGLSSDPLPGGGAQPISIEAYDQISVNLSPYDVKQSGFTGAGIFAVTKSGTNDFHGSAYTFYRDQSFNGTQVRDLDLSASIAKSKNQVFGATVGGPIIKNKLFFFVNYEYEKQETPGISYSPTNGSGLGTPAATTVADLEKVKTRLGTFGYDPGAYDNFPSFKNKNTKILAKLDWNINDDHKLTLKYSDLSATQDVSVNSTSVPNGGGFAVTGLTGTQSRLPNGRYSQYSIAFANANYGFSNPVKTATAELNSRFSNVISNQFLATMSKTQSTRTYPGSVFPTIDIFNGAGKNYITAGMDPYTLNNDVINDTYSLVDNFTYYAGRHTITAGATYEYHKVGNMFMAPSNSYYVYNSLNDFITDAPPVYYAYTYSLVPGQSTVYSAELKIGQVGLYAQDEFNINPNLKVTFGIRADKPIYLQSPLENPQITALQLPNKDGVMTSYNTGRWPKSPFLLSPRAGFRWNVLEDNSLILRGGMGIFTGNIPYVFLTNMPTNTGMYQFGGAIKDAATLANIKFSPNPAAYANLFPQSAGTAVPSNFVVIDPNFKFPQVFRTNLAVEKSLGNGFNLNLEALFTKDVNAVRMRNANLKDPNGVLTEGDMSRPRYLSSADRTYYPGITTAIVLENTNKGYSTNFTAQLSKTFSNGFYGSIAYSYTHAKEVTANPGSTASSVWNSNANVGTSNAIEMGYSGYYTPHRIVSNLSYRIDYAKHAATTLSLFFEGAKNGNPFSYVVSGDLNGDGNSTTDLMYIPKNATETAFVDQTITYNNQTYTFTAAQQSAAFEQFINNTPYLKNRRGQYAERNGAFRPWYNRLDARLMQEFYIMRGAQKHTLQILADVINLPNLLNSNWGIQQGYTVNNPLIFNNFDASGKPTYKLQTSNGKLVTNPYQDVVTTGTTWGMQLGVKYTF